MKLDMPSPDAMISDDLSFTPVAVAFLTRIMNRLVNGTQSGPTGSRPTIGLEIGLTYYDTTLGYLIAVHQVTPTIIWHNGAGAAV